MGTLRRGTRSCRRPATTRTTTRQHKSTSTTCTYRNGCLYSSDVNSTFVVDSRKQFDIRLRRSRTTTRTHSDPSESTRLSEEAQIIVDASEAYPAQTSVDYSFARSGFSNQCERALNEQINVEYNISYVYHAMWAY